MENNEPFKSIENFYTKAKKDQIFLEPAFEGCTLMEIMQIENQLQFTLPITVREFLNFCGKKWRGIYVLHSLQKTLLDKNAYHVLRKSIAKSNEEQGLKKINVDDIIIIYYEHRLADYHWSFIWKNDNAKDPIVNSINYEELEEEVHSFTEYVEKRLGVAIKFAKSLHLPDYRRFQLAMEYVNPYAVKTLHINSYELVLKIPELFAKLSKIEEVIILYTQCSDDFTEIKLPIHKNLKVLKIKVVVKKLMFPEAGFENLESLHLEMPFRTKLPKNLNQNLNLNTLKLTSCGLEKVPDDLYLIKSLKELNLSRNNISFIDNEIRNLINLEELNIGDNSFSITEIERLKKLIPKVKITHHRQEKTDNIR